MCDRCGKVVDWLKRVDDNVCSQSTLIVGCHGETERVVLTEELLEDNRGRMSFGKAFAGGGRLLEEQCQK